MAQIFGDFEGSVLGTAGTELEFLLIDPATGELVSRAIEVIEASRRYEELIGCVTPEMFGDMIEVKTGNGGEWMRKFHMRVHRRIILLMRAASEAGCALLPAAHHPNPGKHARQLFDDPRVGGAFKEYGPRYRSLVERFPELQDGISGNVSVQFHIGLPLWTDLQRAVAIQVADAATALTGVKVAFAANSPNFLMGPDHVACVRQVEWSRLTRSGPYFYRSWAEFGRYVQSLQDDGHITRATELWHTERFNRFSLESRGMDQQPDLEHLFGLWAFVHSLHLTIWNQVVYAGFQPKLPRLEELVERDATVFRLGLTAPHELPAWDIFEGRWATLEAIFDRLVEFITPAADAFALSHDLERFATLMREGRNGSAMQMAWYREEGDVLAVCRRAAAHFAASVESYREYLRR